MKLSVYAAISSFLILSADAKLEAASDICLSAQLTQCLGRTAEKDRKFSGCLVTDSGTHCVVDDVNNGCAQPCKDFNTAVQIYWRYAFDG
jgi:hypothetical protein